MTTPDPTTVDAADPVFISYRQSDGSDITAELAWLLRAAGIPVWRDRDDLPPGDTTERLQQAIDDGLAGGVFVITAEVANSTVVRTVEAPRLLRLHQNHPAFALGIANNLERAPGKLDYNAPDNVLALAPETLSGTDQQPTDRDGLLTLVKKLLGHRIDYQRDTVIANGHRLDLSIQTRNVPQVRDRTGHQLELRVRPSSHEKLPDSNGLRDLQDTIVYLPDTVTRAGATSVRVHGGAHLTVALALGAAVPSTRIGTMEVVDQFGGTWVGRTGQLDANRPLLNVTGSDTNDKAVRTGRPFVAVYVDLLPERSDDAFDRFLDENRASMSAWEHLTLRAEGRINADDADRLSAEVAHRVRNLANSNGNAQVHLLLRCPYPMAVLVGRLLNTLRITAYEWDDSDPDAGDDYRARYVPVMRIRPSAPQGVIEEVII